jgi:hypothetical protein
MGKLVEGAGRVLGLGDRRDARDRPVEHAAEHRSHPHVAVELKRRLPDHVEGAVLIIRDYKDARVPASDQLFELSTVGQRPLQASSVPRGCAPG